MPAILYPLRATKRVQGHLAALAEHFYKSSQP